MFKKTNLSALLLLAASVVVAQLNDYLSPEAEQFNRQRTQQHLHQGVSMAARTTTRVPLAYHMIRTSEGNEQISTNRILDQICLTNQHFTEIGLQFYLYSIDYPNGDTIPVLTNNMMGSFGACEGSAYTFPPEQGAVMLADYQSPERAYLQILPQVEEPMAEGPPAPLAPLDNNSAIETLCYLIFSWEPVLGATSYL